MTWEAVSSHVPNGPADWCWYVRNQAGVMHGMALDCSCAPTRMIGGFLSERQARAIATALNEVETE